MDRDWTSTCVFWDFLLEAFNGVLFGPADLGPLVYCFVLTLSFTGSGAERQGGKYLYEAKIINPQVIGRTQAAG